MNEKAIENKWMEILGELKAGVVTLNEACDKYPITKSQYYYWKEKLGMKIVETAKANNLKVRDYLDYILTKIQKGIEDYTQLLPCSDLLPEDLKIKQ